MYFTCIFVFWYVRREKQRAQLTVRVCVRSFVTILDVSTVDVINSYQNFHQRRKLDMENTVCQLYFSKPSEIAKGLCEPW